MKNLRITGLSALNLDRFHESGRRIEKDWEGFVKEDLSRRPYEKEALGGSGANTTIGLTKLGVVSSLIGKVDEHKPKGDIGGFLIQELQTNGVLFIGQRSREYSIANGKILRPGIAYIETGKNGGKWIGINPGINDYINPREAVRVTPSIVYDGRLHSSTFASHVTDLSLLTQMFLFETLKKHYRDDVTISLSAGLYCSEQFQSPLVFHGLLQYVDELFLNADELQGLTKKGMSDGARFLLGQYKEMDAVFVTHKYGSDAFYRHGRGTKHASTMRQRLPAKFVNDTGAGDAYCAGAIYARMRGEDFGTALRWGQKMAAAACTVKDCISYRPPRLA